jgi:hypothetical protein
MTTIGPGNHEGELISDCTWSRVGATRALVFSPSVPPLSLIRRWRRRLSEDVFRWGTTNLTDAGKRKTGKRDTTGKRERDRSDIDPIAPPAGLPNIGPVPLLLVSRFSSPAGRHRRRFTRDRPATGPVLASAGRSR